MDRNPKVTANIPSPRNCPRVSVLGISSETRIEIEAKAEAKATPWYLSGSGKRLMIVLS